MRQTLPLIFGGGIFSAMPSNTNMISQGRLASVSYAGDRAYSRRPHIYLYEDPLKSDIQLLSYYINKFRQEKAISGSEPDPKKAESVDEKPEITEITE
ncbi:hypothetical protein NQ317_004071 [Molorchus minor]|uniref:Uncharacterized protein n=1 Tax=Molorchus minor TaxID=1323400 RepID=A0ABQ9JPJ1_9CUCU|nr:hypothetical protein NQ317_004071 [Molorchus minor]